MALWTTDADGSRGPYRSLPGGEVFRHRPGRRRDVFLVFVLVFTISCVVGLVRHAFEPRLAFLFAAVFALVGALARVARTTMVEVNDTELVVHSPGGSSERHLRAELRAVALRPGSGSHTLVVRTARGERVLLEGLRRDEVTEAERLLAQALDLPCG